MQFDYFYGREAEQFTFYRIPKVLITAPEFKKVSDSAKLLYSLMLDRMGLSIKNGWVDEYNRAYIFFTVDDIMEYMSCATAKATKLMKELDSKHGIGLVERVKQGQGKPAKIYLKKFISKSENQDFQKPKIQTFEKRKSRVSENESADFQQTKCNYNNSNNTDFSNINPINQDISEIKDRWIEEKQKTVSEIKQQINYDALVNSYDAGVVDNIVGIMTEVMLSDNDRKFKIRNTLVSIAVITTSQTSHPLLHISMKQRLQSRIVRQRALPHILALYAEIPMYRITRTQQVTNGTRDAPLPIQPVTARA